jgi:hypothetical protein
MTADTRRTVMHYGQSLAFTFAQSDHWLPTCSRSGRCIGRFRPSALIVIRAIVLVVLNFYACERVGPSVLAS